MEASFGDNIDLDCGITAGIVHGSGVYLGDRHLDWSRGKVSQGDRKDQELRKVYVCGTR
jgi:hypothetical protein